jgi:choice-of-anchor C domain-containing protein
MPRIPVLLAAVLVLPVSGLYPLSGEEKPAEAANLLRNGSFEEGPEIGPEGWKPLDEDSVEIKGWVVTRGQIDITGSALPAAKGKRSVDLHGTPGFGGIKQTFVTKIGQKYRVTFALAGNPLGEQAVKVMGVRAGGQKEEFTFDTTGKSKDDLGWVTKTWDFTAVGTETTLEFHTKMTQDSFCGPKIDNVSVVAVEK